MLDVQGFWGSFAVLKN